ncbi:hypothetical protein CFP65_3817 [Kitasatospora sp. MMS16-BH015]|uniref:hypothetical protein n=1 Tax=Kitasatospora sp. MMS16-BH015 TaxID=2018025 RepID=UPI000CA1869F|nr:hypothetical protein [Kitasatospora sp. MMS16-BH015]AUG78597.1 hypothetical protein CFP65_3817 [Kitasatospora sp. MMS16-BH015]
MTDGCTPSTLLLGTAGATALAIGGWYAWQTQDHTLRVATVAVALVLVGVIGAARELRRSCRKSAAGAAFLLRLFATAALARRLLRTGHRLGAVIDSLLLTGVAWAAFAAPAADPGGPFSAAWPLRQQPSSP